MSFKGILDWFDRHTCKIVGVSLVLSLSNFLLSLICGEGVDMISDQLFHDFVHVSSGLDIVLLIIIMALLRTRRD